jgi:hypothetical protein
MVVEILDCCFAGCAERKGRNMVKRCGCVECCSRSACVRGREKLSVNSQNMLIVVKIDACNLSVA